MTDRELLELAAKANWRQEIADEEVTLRYSECGDGMLYLHADNQDHNGHDREFRWNPLEQDHDALRLAAKLGLTICNEHESAAAVYCTRTDIEDFPVVTSGEMGDPHGITDEDYAATRRAIVMAAAEIGKAQP